MSAAKQNHDPLSPPAIVSISSQVQCLSVSSLVLMPVWLFTAMALPLPGEKMATLVKAANVSIESYWPGLFAKLVEKRNIEGLIMNVGSGGGGGDISVSAPAGGAATSSAIAPAAEEKEETKESDDDMGFSLFD